MSVNIFRTTTIPTISSARQRNLLPTAPDPYPDPATGDLWIDMSQTPPVLKVLDGALSGVTIATPPGTPTGTLQFNSAGAFGGVIGSTVGATGAVTLSPNSGIVPLTLTPVGNTNTGLSIFNMTGATVGLSIQRGSSTGDAIRILNGSAGQMVTFNVDLATGPVLKLTTAATEDKPVLQLRRPNAAAITDLFQVYDSGDVNLVFLVNPSGPTTGTVRITPLSGLQGLIINTTGTFPDGLIVQHGGASVLRAGRNALNIAAAQSVGVSIGGGVEVHLTTQSSPSTLDIVLQTGPVLGSRLIQGSTFGTNDVTHSLVTGSGGWAVFENNIANAGVMISTSGALPISIRPNRTETGKFPSGGGLVLLQAAPTVAASQVGYGATTATTVGAAGGASALPATPTGYLIINVAGTAQKIPYYAN